MAKEHSFDITAKIDMQNFKNAINMVDKEVANRYDFKGTPAEIDWLGDKIGFKIIGSNEWQIDSIIDIIRKKLASREQSSKILDLSKIIATSNMKSTKEVPFIDGLDQEKAKKLTKLIRDEFPKIKPQIQGEAVQVVGSSKDNLQNVMQLIKAHDLNFPVTFNNYR